MRSRSSPLSRGRSNGTPVRRRREEAPIGQAGTGAQKLRASATADSEDERALLAALRDGDEAAFTGLVERHHAALTRVAMLYVRDAVMVLCPDCTSYVEQMRATITAVGALREEAVDPRTRDTLLHVFRR